jgi:2-octaprenylphenol hydroxylase
VTHAPDKVFDVIVNGGGLVGLAFALQLQRHLDRVRPDLSIAVLDRQPPAEEWDAEIGLRVSALAPSSRQILDTCGVWAQVPPERVGVYRRMCVWRGENPADPAQRIAFDAAEQGVAELGYIVENDLLRLLLWRESDRHRGIRLISQVAPSELERHRDTVTVRLTDGQTVQGRLIVGADGAGSWVREQMGVATTDRICCQRAIVVHVSSEKPHKDSAWQRFLPDGPVALLPLADGRSSVVWSVAESRADGLLALTDDAFGRALTQATNDVLGHLRVASERVSFPLAMSHTHQYSGSRFALIGDAAHRVHPLAGQGVNLGLLDAAALAETLASHLKSTYADAGDPAALRKFERWRKGDNLLTLALMEAVHRLFTSDHVLVPRSAGLGLGIIDRLSPIKRCLAEYAMGRTADAPRTARIN